MLCFSKMNILRMILINLGKIFLKINNNAFVHIKFSTGALLASQCKSGVEAYNQVPSTYSVTWNSLIISASLFHLLPQLIMM